MHTALDDTPQRWSPVRAVLALTIATVPLLRRRPYELGDHRVCTLRMLDQLLTADGPVPSDNAS